MLKRILFGTLWFAVFYFVAVILTHSVAGSTTANPDPAKAGTATVASLRIYFLLGALVLSVAGTVLGILPGTKSNSKPSVGGKQK